MWKTRLHLQYIIGPTALTLFQSDTADAQTA